MDSSIYRNVYFSDVLMLLAASFTTGYQTVWIVAERLLAVLFPLKTLLAARKVWLLVLLTFSASFLWNVCCYSMHSSFSYDHSSDISAGKVVEDRNGLQFSGLLFYFVHILLYWVPSLLLILGCSIIIIKLVITRTKYRSLTSLTKKQSSTTGVNVTFLVICFNVLLSHLFYQVSILPVQTNLT